MMEEGKKMKGKRKEKDEEGRKEEDERKKEGGWNEGMKEGG